MKNAINVLPGFLMSKLILWIAFFFPILLALIGLVFLYVTEIDPEIKKSHLSFKFYFLVVPLLSLVLVFLLKSLQNLDKGEDKLKLLEEEKKIKLLEVASRLEKNFYYIFQNIFFK